jgi:2-keto-3-deoxy-L-fuconate dehydrogenase
MASLDGIALITAAGQGIGCATVLRFANEGAIVGQRTLTATPRRSTIGESCHPDAHSRCIGFESRRNHCRRDWHDRCLFNCAGFVHQGSIFECSKNELNYSLDFNVTSMYRTCRVYRPGMLANGKGSIINMSSIVSSLKGAQPFCLRSQAP